MAQAIRGVIAVFLLSLYAYAIYILVKEPTVEPISQVRTILTVVGGLVSALIVAVLAVTPPNGSPASIFVDESSRFREAVTIVTWAYVSVWLVCGGVLLYFWMTPGNAAKLVDAVAAIPKPPDAIAAAPSKTLDAAATSWLGLAVAAAYAYLGLKKS